MAETKTRSKSIGRDPSRSFKSLDSFKEYLGKGKKGKGKGKCKKYWWRTGRYKTPWLQNRKAKYIWGTYLRTW